MLYLNLYCFRIKSPELANVNQKQATASSEFRSLDKSKMSEPAAWGSRKRQGENVLETKRNEMSGSERMDGCSDTYCLPKPSVIDVPFL